MFWLCYNLLFHLVYLLMLPHFLWRMRRRGGYRAGFLQRIFRLSEADRLRLSEGRWLWVHAVSVGEWQVARSFIRAWRDRHPEARFLITINTSTGQALARPELDPRDLLLYPPVDSPPVLRRLLRGVDLQGLVLVETELWPNLIRLADAAGVPVVLLNGRMSDRSFRRLRRVRFLTRRVFPRVRRFCAQSEEDARRFIELGAPAESVAVMHSLKYEGIIRDPTAEAQRRERLLAAGFLGADSRVLLGSSTWPGEERLLAEIFRRLRDAAGVPDLKLILVPRHAERRAEVLADCRAAGVDPVCWSVVTDDALGAAEALLVDTTGELRHFTALADLVFVGKSLFRPEGQNPLEAAAAGRCVLTGPGMHNFRDIMADLRAAEAVREVADPAALTAALVELLADPAAARAQGVRAARLVDSRRGALQRSVEECEKVLFP